MFHGMVRFRKTTHTLFSRRVFHAWRRSQERFAPKETRHLCAYIQVCVFRSTSRLRPLITTTVEPITQMCLAFNCERKIGCRKITGKYYLRRHDAPPLPPRPRFFFLLGVLDFSCFSLYLLEVHTKCRPSGSIDSASKS